MYICCFCLTCRGIQNYHNKSGHCLNNHPNFTTPKQLCLHTKSKLQKFTSCNKKIFFFFCLFFWFSKINNKPILFLH